MTRDRRWPKCHVFPPPVQILHDDGLRSTSGEANLPFIYPPIHHTSLVVTGQSSNCHRPGQGHQLMSEGSWVTGGQAPLICSFEGCWVWLTAAPCFPWWTVHASYGWMVEKRTYTVRTTYVGYPSTYLPAHKHLARSFLL